MFIVAVVDVVLVVWVVGVVTIVVVVVDVVVGGALVGMISTSAQFLFEHEQKLCVIV